MATHSPVRSSLSSSSSSSSSSSTTISNAASSCPCWSRAVLIDSASQVNIQRCGACPPVSTSYANLRQMYNTQKQLVAHEAVFTVLAALRDQFEAEIHAHTSTRARGAANAFRKKSNASTEPPSVSLGSRPHLTMSIPLPRPVPPSTDGAAVKIAPPQATKPQPPPLVSDLPMQCELNVAFRNRVWIDIMRSGSVVLLWPLEGHQAPVGKRKRPDTTSRLPILLAQTYAGGVREYTLSKKKMVGLTFLVCSCGHNIARDFPGTTWAVTPVTSLLIFERMFKVVASSPKKLPFSHLLLGRPTAAHTVFSDSSDDDGEGDEEDNKDDKNGGGKSADGDNDAAVIDLLSDVDEELMVDLTLAKEVSRVNAFDSSEDEEAAQSGAAEAAAMARKKALAELPPDSSEDSSEESSDDDDGGGSGEQTPAPTTPPTSMKINDSFEASVCATLNLSQKIAIDMCVGLSKSSSRPTPLVLLQGPPGTGKTTTIVRLLQVLRNRGLRVAVCSSTNKAVSVVMAAFMKEAVKTGPTGGLCTPLGPNAYLVGVEDQVEPQLRDFFIHDQPELLRASLEWCEREAAILLEWYSNNASKRADGSIHVMQEYPGIGDILEKIESWMATARLVIGFDFDSDDFYFHVPVIHAIRDNWNGFRSEQTPIQEAMQFLQDPTAYRAEPPAKDKERSDLQKKDTDIIYTLPQLQTGHLKYLADSIAHYRQFLNQHLDDRSIEKALLNQAQFIFCTLSISGRSSMSPRNLHQGFDVLVVDEAAQPIEAELLIATTLRPKQLILVGDPRQLSATVASPEAQRAGFGSSLMTRLVNVALEKKGAAFHMLDVQYRMDPLIAKLPSDTFYGSTLKNGDCVSLREEQRKEHFLTDTLGALAFIDCEAGREERARRGGSLYNCAEAEVVAHIVFLLTATHPGRWGGHRNFGGPTIRVLTFYRAQVVEIRRRIERMQRQQQVFSSPSQIRVDTVDSMQGSEADIIILSFVRSSRYCGFLADERRLNVALTRAKCSLILVGRKSTLEQSDASHIVSFMESIKERNLFRTLPHAPSVVVRGGDHHQHQHQHQQPRQHGTGSARGARARRPPLILPNRHHGNQHYSRLPPPSPAQHQHGRVNRQLGEARGIGHAHASSVPMWKAPHHRQVDKEPRSKVRPKQEKDPSRVGPKYDDGGVDIFRSQNTHARQEHQKLHAFSKKKRWHTRRPENPERNRNAPVSSWMGEMASVQRPKRGSKKHKKRHRNRRRKKTEKSE
jgi:hypothetical protein